jgi:hypothetical protein
MLKIELIEGTLDTAGGYCINGKRYVGGEHEALVAEAMQMAYESGRNVKEVLVQIVPEDAIMQKGDIVIFRDAKDPGDENAKMVLVEDPDGGRVLVRHLVDMKIQPTSIYLTKDLQLCGRALHGDE